MAIFKHIERRLSGTFVEKKRAENSLWGNGGHSHLHSYKDSAELVYRMLYAITLSKIREGKVHRIYR